MVSEVYWRSHHNTCGTRGHAQSQTCSGRVAARGQPISADKAGARPSWDGNPQVRVRAGEDNQEVPGVRNSPATRSGQHRPGFEQSP